MDYIPNPLRETHS